MELSLQEQSFNCFIMAVEKIMPKENIMTRFLLRFAYGTDASFYRLVPKVVLRVENESELRQVITLANTHAIAVTFRAAGTSLSGQAITDSVLIILSRHWQGIDVLSQGDKICLQPGVIGAHANQALAAYDRKIGPDPASINSCKIGGIAANNASGMCCGVKDNSYHTLADIKLVFADGSQLDTALASSRAAFKVSHKHLLNEIVKLSNELKSQPTLADKIKHKYRLKNTTGYGINALIDFDDPIDMISHLMIGSEGSLAFIADITYNTVKVMKKQMAGLFVFNDIKIACEVVHLLANENVLAIELMDSRALHSVALQLTDLLPFEQIDSQSTGLLIEFGADTSAQMNILQERISAHINIFSKYLQCSKPFTSNSDVIAALWKIRKGMFPAVGAKRKVGTTVIIEDIALPLVRLAEGVEDLHQLFDKYGYKEAIIFGHALAGNLHFVFTQAFDTPTEVKRYSDFMSAVTQMVAVEYQGSLKAEHGTGRNMAAFVELEWGHDIYLIMAKLKALFDPKNILNPGVIINNDANAHINHLKTMVPADEQIDKCIECGFCESVCPSKELTLTARQRISVWRRICELSIQEKQSGLTLEQQQQYQSLLADYQYYGIDSCAATGLCGQECPVGIDTGQFIKSLRAKNNQIEKVPNKIAISVANTIARHFSPITSITKVGLQSVSLLAGVVGDKATTSSFTLLNRVSQNIIPKWYPAWPKAAKKYTSNDEVFADKVIYIPSCANRVFATDHSCEDQRSIIEVMQSILSKAKLEMVIPKNINNFCCGMPWASKGFQDTADRQRQAFIDLVENVSEQGRWPVVTDASPCALTLKSNARQADSCAQTKQLPDTKIYEASEFIAKHVVDKLHIVKSSQTFLLHKTCSSIKMDEGKYLTEVVSQCSDNIVVPEHISCCGFAGDKGFSLPELNESALQPLASQVPVGCQGGLSNSRTCEIGLSKHSDIGYQSFLYLLDEVSVEK